MICWKCQKEINITEIHRTTECPECTADLHCCKACKYYAPGNHYDCKETIEDPVADKEKSNFCDYFSLGDCKGKKSSNAADKARDAFNALFG